MIGITTGSKSKKKASMALIVRTKEGKTYNLGIQKKGRFIGPITKWLQDRRIKHYYNDRVKHITNPKELSEFKAMIIKLRKDLQNA